MGSKVDFSFLSQMPFGMEKKGPSFSRSLVWHEYQHCVLSFRRNLVWFCNNPPISEQDSYRMTEWVVGLCYKIAFFCNVRGILFRMSTNTVPQSKKGFKIYGKYDGIEYIFVNRT